MPVSATFFKSLKDGMNSGINPAFLPESQCARMTNVGIELQLPTTRPGFRVLPMDGAVVLKDLAIQGAVIYNPAKGLSQQSFANDLTRIVLAAGGRRFEIRLTSSSAGTSQATVEEILGAPNGNPDLHLCWMYQAETFAISQDGSSCWIWDTNSAKISPGYVSGSNKEASRLANEATTGVYSHGRILQVVDGRKVLIGDIIHKENLTSPINILGMTEQVYWATGSFLSPPSNMGAIMAAGILAKKNTQHGHEETMLHSPDGVFSVNLNVYPREKWAETQLTAHALLGTGACGPYGLAVDDGDQIFRSKHGVQSLRSAAGEAQNLGNPTRPISWQINDWMRADHLPYLRFCSLDKWTEGARILCTTGIGVKGLHWSSRGVVSYNLNPSGSSGSSPSWEGLWTTPPNVPAPVLILSGEFAGSDRCLVLCYDDENQIQLGEFHPSLDRDYDNCGHAVEISSQIITSELAAGDLFITKEHSMGTLVFRKMRRTVKFGVWLRTNHDDPWTLWKSGEATHRPESDPPALRRVRDKEVVISLGEVPDTMKSVRKLQALIRWKGYCQVEGIKIYAAAADAEEGQGQDTTAILIPTEFDYGDYDDYEYPAGSQWATPK